MQTQQLTADEAAVLAAGGDLEKGGGAGAMPEGQMGAEGGLAPKAPGAPMKKAEEGEEDEEDETEGEGEDMEKKDKSCKKSEVAEADLIKAMDHLEAVANGIGGEPDRRAELAGRLADGTLDKSERSELLSLIGGDDGEDLDDGEDFQKSLSDSWAESDQLGEDYDVSPFLEKLGTGIAASLDSMRGDLEKSLGSQQSFNRALAKSMRGMGQVVVEQAELVKSLQAQNEALAQRLGIVERTPVGRKSAPTAGALQKSFSDGSDGADLSRDKILTGLEQLMIKSADNGWMAPCGEPVDRAMARYEATGAISASMLGDVKNVLGKQTPNQ